MRSPEIGPSRNSPPTEGLQSCVPGNRRDEWTPEGLVGVDEVGHRTVFPTVLQGVASVVGLGTEGRT